MKNEQYFSYIINNLTFEEVEVLLLLNQADATAAFKSIKRSQVAEETKYTEAVFRKIIGKLSATFFINTVITGKEHRIYLTEYGMTALKHSLKGAIQ